MTRSWLAHRSVNQYGAAALAAIVASGIYVRGAALARHTGFQFAHYPSGFISWVLFLIPGFPLIAGLFDLLQYQTVAAVSRLAYGVMMLLAVALGLSIVIAVAGVDNHASAAARAFVSAQAVAAGDCKFRCSMRVRDVVQHILRARYSRWAFWLWWRMTCA